METGYDKEYSEIEGLEMCESCAWAIWDIGDWSVGMIPGVDDCKAPMSLRLYENLFADIPRRLCPWYSRQFPRENERIRCKNCNSPKWKVTKCISDMTKEYGVEEYEITCEDCGEKQIRDCMDVGYSVNE